MALQIRKCKSGFLAATLHYSADRRLWPPKRIAAAKAALSGWQWRKEYEIDFTARGGQKVFDCFDPAVHVTTQMPDPTECRCFRVIDHGRRNPSACLWWAEDNNSNMYFYREYYRANATISEHCQMIRALNKEYITATLIDPSTHRRLDNSSATIADEYQRSGINTVPADNSMAAGIEAVTAALLAGLARWSIDKQNLHRHFENCGTDFNVAKQIAQNRAIYFHPSMTNTIRQMGQLAWDHRADDDPYRSLSEQIIDVDDHCTDCVRYAVMRIHSSVSGIRSSTLRRI